MGNGTVEIPEGGHRRRLVFHFAGRRAPDGQRRRSATRAGSRGCACPQGAIVLRDGERNRNADAAIQPSRQEEIIEADRQ